MNQSITDYLKEAAYPNLDAVDSGLFDNLKPSSLLPAGNYTLICPACGMREGFYYPGRSHIQCNRKKHCGQSTSIWDVLSTSGMQPREIIRTICSKAGVSVPERESNPASPRSPSALPGETPTPYVSPGKAIFQVTQSLARKHPHLLEKLKNSRGFTDTDMAAMRLGVYTKPEEVLEGLLALGVSRETAVEKGYIEVDSEDPSKLLKGSSNRVVGYWPHPDKDVRLWGRLAEGSGDKYNPKYRFAPNLSKDIPYLFQQRKPTVLCTIEGAFDAWSLSIMGYWAACVGGASVNAAQAAYLASQGVTEQAAIIDGDNAGYDGAISTIRNCESVGIVTSVVPLGNGMDDPDAMRKAGRIDEMKQLIENRINSGEFLARIASAYVNQPQPYLKGLRRVLSAAEALTPVSRHYWLDFSKSLNIPLYSDASAVRLLANLMDGGLDFPEASARVRDRTGFVFSKEVPAHG